MTDDDILKALNGCSSDVGCGGCPYYDLGSSSCISAVCKDAAKLIEKQKEVIDKYAVINRLNEQDIADLNKMLEQKVEVVYEDFMKDYKCLKEELEGLYDEYEELKAEIERLQNEIILKNAALLSIKDMAKGLPQLICDHCFPSFDLEGRPVNIWKAKEGYDAVDALVERIVKEASK